MTKNKPVYEKRIGSIRLAIWENENQGKPWFNVSVVRRWKEGEQWTESSTFNGLADLTHLAKAVELGMEWIERRENGGPGGE